MNMYLYIYMYICIFLYEYEHIYPNMINTYISKYVNIHMYSIILFEET